MVTLFLALEDEAECGPPNEKISKKVKHICESKSEKLILKSNPQMDLDTPTRYKLMQTTLIDQELIESKKAKIFDDLRQLRNRVAHAEGFAVSKEQALSYISVAIALAEYLDEKLR